MRLMNTKTGEVVTLDREQGALKRLYHARRRVIVWQHVMSLCASDAVWVLVRLSYAPPLTWGPNHVREFMLAVRKVVPVLGYAWVAEMQQRGEVHYHA